jgi:hypothetical protein
VLAYVVVPPLVDMMMISGGPLMQLLAIRNYRKIVKCGGKFGIVGRDIALPVLIEGIQQARYGIAKRLQEANGLKDTIAITIFARNVRARRKYQCGSTQL